MSLTVEAVDGIIAEDAAIDKDVGLAVVGVASGAEQACHRERGIHYALCTQLQVTWVRGHKSCIMLTAAGHTGHRAQILHYAHSCRSHGSQGTSQPLCTQLQVTGHESAITHTATDHTGHRARVSHYAHNYRSHGSEGKGQPLCTQLQVTRVRGQGSAIMHTATGDTGQRALVSHDAHSYMSHG